MKDRSHVAGHLAGHNVGPEHRLLSTGAYGFPAALAARIAVGTVVSELSAAPRSITQVLFCCFSDDSAAHHQIAFAELGLA